MLVHSPDLFDRYWGRADLDVDGTDFVHDGKKWGPAKKTMMELFRPNVETITAGRDQFCNFKQMIEIRLARRALALLLCMLFGRETRGGQYAPDLTYLIIICCHGVPHLRFILVVRPRSLP